MAYDYLGLINDVNRRLNEVELTTSNFATATGEYGMIKDAVNASIRYINQHEYEWPFNHVTADETMTAGVVRYAFPTDARSSAFKFGKNFGIWIGILESLSIKYEMVTPQKWQKQFELPKNKQQRKKELKMIAKEFYPKATLYTADAICIGLWGKNNGLI